MSTINKAYRKQVKINLSLKQAEMLKEILGNQIIRLSEDGEQKHADKIDVIDEKITKAINKNGIFYKWQNIGVVN